MKISINEPNIFCYICGEYTLKNNSNTIHDFVKHAYFACFKGCWLPTQVLVTTNLMQTLLSKFKHQWTNRTRKCLRLAIPMRWCEQKIIAVSATIVQ